MSERRRLPSTWVSHAETTSTSMRLKHAQRSRLTGCGPQGPTGTSAAPSLQKRYYASLRELKRALRRLRSGGGDVEAALRGLGSVYVRQGDGYAQVPAEEAVLLIRGPDTLPHHLRDRDPGDRASLRETLDQDLESMG